MSAAAISGEMITGDHEIPSGLNGKIAEENVSVANDRSCSLAFTKNSSALGLDRSTDRQLRTQNSTLSSSLSTTVSVVEETAKHNSVFSPAGEVAAAPLANNITDKNPLQVFNEYVAALFQKAEVYEKELERRESRIDLQASVDDVRHGGTTLHYNGSRIDLVEEDNTPMQEKSINEMPKPESSPRLSPMSEAVAAVEAISSFRSFNEVKREMSFRSDTGNEMQDSKRQKSDRVIDGRESIEEKWNEFCGMKSQNTFAEVAIDDIALSLTVDELYELVLRDNAPNSIGKFMTGNGDFDVETTLWEPTNAQRMTRTIHYTHPVNVPMAPPSAKAFKTPPRWIFSGNRNLVPSKGRVELILPYT